MSLVDASLLSLLYKLLKVNIFGVFSLTAFPALCLVETHEAPVAWRLRNSYVWLSSNTPGAALRSRSGDSLSHGHSIALLCFLLKAEEHFALQN